MKITDKYFKKLSKNLLSDLGSEKTKLKTVWDVEIPKPVKDWAYPVELRGKSLFIFVRDREKRQSFKGENEKIIIEKFRKNSILINKIEIINGIKR